MDRELIAEIAIGGPAVLIALRSFDNPSSPLHNPSNPFHWHFAIIWTAILACLLVYLRRWTTGTPLYWPYVLLVLCAHLAAMWYLFGVLFPSLQIGTLFAGVPAFFESITLVAQFQRLERRFGITHRGRHPRPAPHRRRKPHSRTAEE